MQSLKKVADKIATPTDGAIIDTRTSTTTTTAVPTHATNISDRNISFANDINMSQQNGINAGRIVDQHQVGTVDVIETTQTVKKVPVVETTRVLETGVAGLSVHEHDHHHKHDHIGAHHHMESSAVHVDLPTTVDHKTVVTDTVVEERLRKDVLVQVQPVVHKEVEVEEVHHVVKHINEAPAPSVAGSVTLAPVVQEHVHTHIIEEIHPVIHREIVVQEVERVEQHVTEHVVVPTKHIHETITEIAPVHVHDAHCHHEVATDRLTSVILPGTTGLPASQVATTVTTREVFTEKEGHKHGHSHDHGHVVGTHTEVLGANTGMRTGVIGTHTEVLGANTGMRTGLVETHTGVAANGMIVDDRVHVDKVVATKHGGQSVTTHRNGVVEEVVLKPGDELLLQKNNITGDAVLLEKRHNGKLVDDGLVHDHHVEAGGSKHHHHMHLPHFLGGHKKEETVVTESTTKHTVL